MSHKFVVDGHQHEVAGREDVAKLDVKTRLALYNQLTGKTTTKFAGTEKGIEQTWKAVQEHDKPAATETAVKPPEFQEDPPRPGSTAAAELAESAPKTDKPAETVGELYDKLAGEKAAAAATKPPKPPRTAKVPKPEGEAKAPRALAFNLPLTADIKRPGRGKRLAIFEMLQRKEGATFEEVQTATGWDRKTAYEGIRLLHTYCGYGLKQGENGAIHLVVPKEGKSAAA